MKIMFIIHPVYIISLMKKNGDRLALNWNQNLELEF
jgi:hypothetical protein